MNARFLKAIQALGITAMLVLLPGLAASAGADLALTMTAAPNPVPPGQTLAYSLSVANQGAKPARGVVLTARLPGQAALVSAPRCGFAGRKARKLNTLTCKTGRIRPGESASWEITVQAPQTSGEIVNDASVKFSRRDANPDNNARRLVVLVAPAAPVDPNDPHGGPNPDPNPPNPNPNPNPPGPVPPGPVPPDPGKPPVEFSSIARDWWFSAYSGDGRKLGQLAAGNVTLGEYHNSDRDPLGATILKVVDEGFNLGGLIVAPPDLDPLAEVLVYSNETGMTYWAGAEAPAGRLGTDELIGSHVKFEQHQKFRKQSEDATLELVISNARVDLIDSNTQSLTFQECPWGDDFSFESCGGVMEATINFKISIWSPGHPAFTYGRDAWIKLEGWRSHFQAEIDYDWWEAWDASNFVVNTDLGGTGTGTFARIYLKAPIVIAPSLKDLPVGATVFVNTEVTALAFNHRQGESYAGAYFRDPARTRGTEIRATGLEPVPMLELESFDPTAVAAPACIGPADPLAGTVQLERAAFSQRELPGLGAPIRITRTGGLSGPLSVTLTASGGTATPGADYAPVAQRVYFPDGDYRTKTVRVPIALDAETEGDETVELRLSDLRGCGALGVLTSGVLTIGDDDRAPPPVVSFTVGGTVSGLAGSGLVLEDRAQFVDLPVSANGSFVFNRNYSPGAGYDVRVKVQPSNPVQVCTVTRGAGTVLAKVSDIAVDCVAQEVPAGLDPGFGSGGRVTTGLGGYVTALALQGDGKIVAGGATRLGRYRADGSLDTSFGSNGVVSAVFGGVNDELFDVAVQPDGKIVVAGVMLPQAGNSLGFDFAAARFLPDGTRDTGFGQGGVVHVDFIGAPDRAYRVLLQPDGKILLAGLATTVFTPSTDDGDFAVVRLNGDGSLDSTFGGDGRATANLAQLDFGYGAALQEDGKIVVAGRVNTNRGASSDIGVARFLPDGALDPAFGTAGTTRINLSAQSDEAVDLVIQPDGKLVLAVALKDVTRFAYALLRLRPDGSRDAGFGSNGLVKTDLGPLDDTARALALQADGKIVLAGQASSATVSDFGVVRYRPDGSLDPDFGTGGLFTVDFFSALDGANDVLIQPDGKIVVGGLARNGLAPPVGLCRMVP